MYELHPLCTLFPRVEGGEFDAMRAFSGPGCPFPITVLAYMPGGLDEESELHKRFAAFRAHGEWFHATDELLAYIEEVEANA